MSTKSKIIAFKGVSVKDTHKGMSDFKDMPAQTIARASSKKDFDFVEGEVVFGADNMPKKRRAIWDDPDVIEFAKTGNRPEWDVEEFLRAKFPTSTKA